MNKDKKIAMFTSGLISGVSLLILTSLDTSIKPRENFPTTPIKVKIVELDQEEPKPKVQQKKEVKKQEKEPPKKVLKNENQSTKKPLEKINEPEPISKIAEKVESPKEKNDVKPETQNIAKEIQKEPQSKEQDKDSKKEEHKIPPPPPPQNIKPSDLDLLSLYLSKVKSIVDKKKRYPEEAKRFGVAGKVSIKITVNNDGSIKDFSLIKSSGSRILDQEALALIKSIVKFPEPPEGKELTFVLTIDYQLEE
jgi:protein TonB